MHKEVLIDDGFVCMMRRGHRLAGKRLTLGRFCAASHALVAPIGKPGGYVDDALAALGRSRRVALVVPNFLAVPHVIAATDLLLTLGERVARTFEGPLALHLAKPPLELGRIVILQLS